MKYPHYFIICSADLMNCPHYFIICSADFMNYPHYFIICFADLIMQHSIIFTGNISRENKSWWSRYPSILHSHRVWYTDTRGWLTYQIWCKRKHCSGQWNERGKLLLSFSWEILGLISGWIFIVLVFVHGGVCCEYSLELPQWGDSKKYSKEQVVCYRLATHIVIHGIWSEWVTTPTGLLKYKFTVMISFDTVI